MPILVLQAQLLIDYCGYFIFIQNAPIECGDENYWWIYLIPTSTRRADS